MPGEMSDARRSGRPGKPSVVVFDYGSGNVRSAVRALEHVGAQVELTSSREAALAADGLFVPGVGNFHACMAGLQAAEGPLVIDLRLSGGRPVLGVCVGMQVLFDGSDEPSEVRREGLGEWPGTVARLRADVIPHMGWATVDPPADTRLFAGVESERFYFVHSYAVQDWVLEPPTGPFAAVAPEGHLGRARWTLRRRGRERPVVGDPVPPREVRRRRADPARELGAVPVSPSPYAPSSAPLQEPS